MTNREGNAVVVIGAGIVGVRDAQHRQQNNGNDCFHPMIREPSS